MMPGKIPASLTGDSILQLARTHLGEDYRFGALAPKNDSNWKGPWDCAEFPSWLVFQTAVTLYGCEGDSGNPATAKGLPGFWERDANRLGRIVSVEYAAKSPGAFILRKSQ